MAPATENLSQTYIENAHPRVWYTMGFYNGSEEISKWSTPPPQCNFGGARSEFVYLDINTYGGGTAYVGYSGYPICGAGKWSHDQVLDIHAALILLIQKDGWKSTAKSGD